jgi:hypothetical protein
MDFAFDRLHDLDEKFRAKRRATDDWARLVILGVFDNALDLEWLRNGEDVLERKAKELREELRALQAREFALEEVIRSRGVAVPPESED